MMNQRARRKLTTHQIATMLGASDQSVSNWIDAGLLPATRTPGGHRRVERDDLIIFLRRQQMGIPPELSPGIGAILVVDDELSVTEWLVIALRQAFPQRRVLTASDGFAAGRIVSSERPEVVILDLYMPGLDGFGVCRQIKSDPQTSWIKVIAITAYPSDQTEADIRNAGADVYLSKPVDVEHLAGHIHELSGSIHR